jgi:hypothetical protein
MQRHVLQQTAHGHLSVVIWQRLSHSEQLFPGCVNHAHAELAISATLRTASGKVQDAGVLGVRFLN